MCWVPALGGPPDSNLVVIPRLTADFLDGCNEPGADRQYAPFIFTCEGQTVVPRRRVDAAFEPKQAINADQVAYAPKYPFPVDCFAAEARKRSSFSQMMEPAAPGSPAVPAWPAGPPSPDAPPLPPPQ